MTEHSGWSASGFEAMMLCPGKKVLEAGLPNNANEYSSEGTAAHLVLTWSLQQGNDAVAYLGRKIHLDDQGNPCEAAGAKFTFTVDDDMAENVQNVVGYVRDLMKLPGASLWVDTRVDYSRYLGLEEGEAWGTLDVAVILPDELITIDLKYGRGVEVSAGESLHDVADYPDGTSVPAQDHKPNPQLALYGLGTVARLEDLLGERPANVRLVIAQPRISGAPSEYVIPTDALEAWALSTARSAVNTVRNAVTVAAVGVDAQAEFEATFLNPGEKACRFCRAKATCPALREQALATIYNGSIATPDDFADAPADKAVLASVPLADSAWLDAVFPKLEMIEDWAKAVLAEIERRALAGEAFKSAKVVKGKRGNRAWADPEKVELYLKETVRLKTEDMYSLKLISPTALEKLAPKMKDGKPVPVPEGAPAPLIGPRQWSKLQAEITQAEGKPHIAPISDSRPAITVTPAADDFEPVTDSQTTSTVNVEDLA